MEISRTAMDVLDKLDRGAHLMHDVVGEQVDLYDGDPAAGSPRGSQRVEMKTFVELRDNKLIRKTGGREVRQYKISEAGRAALSAAKQL
jgi:hypothetical protein